MIIDNLPDVIVRTLGWCMTCKNRGPSNTLIIETHAAEIITLSNGPALQTAAQPKTSTYLANPIPSLGKKEAVKCMSPLSKIKKLTSCCQTQDRGLPRVSPSNPPAAGQGSCNV